jgi:hypothetical protein
MFYASTLEVFIASTNDLSDARSSVENVLRDWSSRNGKPRNIMLKPIRWEKDTTPELGAGSFQDVINQTLLNDADILVGIIGKRLGSPTKNSVAGTVEEIDRFHSERKPVLLYFSDESFNLSEIDTKELERVREFRKAMQEKGLYDTFKSNVDLMIKLKNHLDSLLADFRALPIPAAEALAEGYFHNFIKDINEILGDVNSDGLREVELSDYKIVRSGDKQREMKLVFNTFNIWIAKPRSLSDATNEAVRDMKYPLREISVRNKSTRRAFRIYVPKEVYEILEAERGKNSEEARLDTLDLVDFPTPLIALRQLVERRTAAPSQSSLAHKWPRQADIQYGKFFEHLETCRGKWIRVSYFDFYEGCKLPV